LNDQLPNSSILTGPRNIAREINEVFPHKVCINLDRRADRWTQMQLKFAQLDIRSVRRFSAVDGQELNVPHSWSNTPGAYGCLLSHLQVVRQAQELGAPSVLIFEDDVVFDPRLRESFSSYFQQVPKDWDVLHFGVMHLEEPIKVAENVQRVRRAYSTFAYALNHTIFERFIELNSKANTPVDVNNFLLQSEHRVYCFMPHLSWVENDGSDVQERQKDHWYLRESLVILGRAIEERLKQTTLIIAHQNAWRNEGSTENLFFLARFYRERLPGIRVVIVEQDREATINPKDLPLGCQYLLLREGGPLDRGLCFNTGMKISKLNSSFLIFSDSDVFVEEWDIRGQLRICERYDGTTGCRNVIELNSCATEKLRINQAMLTPWFKAQEYTRQEKQDQFSRFCVFKRSSLEAAGGWVEQRAAETAPILSLKVPGALRVFDAPNEALLLRHE